jgi:transposase
MDIDQILLCEKNIARCEAMMSAICDEHFHEEVKLLESIPGIKEKSAMSIIAEAGADMEVFPSASSLVGWAGLRPGNDQSAGKIKSRTDVTHTHRN